MMVYKRVSGSPVVRFPLATTSCKRPLNLSFGLLFIFHSGRNVSRTNCNYFSLQNRRFTMSQSRRTRHFESASCYAGYTYRIFSNNSRGRLISFLKAPRVMQVTPTVFSRIIAEGDQFLFSDHKRAIIRG